MPKLFLTAALAAAALVMVVPATAPAATGTHTCQGVVSQSGISPPAGYTQVVNAVMKVTNDEDTGFVGYWALENYTKHIQAWADGTGNFYVAATYQGTWNTFAGALSPEDGIPELSNGTGSTRGGYIATMSGSMLASPGEPTHGTIGAYDFGGTQSDVLLGTYGNGQTGDANPTDWLSFYFTPSTINTFAYDNWGWRYTGNTTSGPWCNTALGSSGDIVTH